MKSKMFRRVIAVLSAMTMAVTMTVTSASAETSEKKWELRRVIQNGYTPTEAQISEYTVIFRTKSYMTGCTSSCTNYTSGKAYNGTRAYARVIVKETDIGGKNPKTISSYYYYPATDSETTIMSGHSVVYGKEMRAIYSLVNPHAVSVNISGNCTGIGAASATSSIVH